MTLDVPDPLIDVPSVVTYGEIVGYFVSFVADSGDDTGNAPDQIPLTGTVTLTPTVSVTRWPTTTPPRTAIIQRVVCKLIDGTLTAPAGDRVFVVATDQPAGQPSVIQWTASFKFDNVAVQPASVTFNVPTNGVVDLSTIVPLPPEPPTVIVVSTETAEAAEQSAADAAQSAADAAAIVATAPHWWTGTQAQYDALPTKDPKTLYLVVP